MKDDLPFLFRQLTHGVYVIGVSGGGKDNAFTAAWVMQVSFSPPMIALSINPGHSSYRMLVESRAFSINVLPANRKDLAKHFGLPAETDKLAGVAWRRGETGVPLLNEAMAVFECEYSHECEAGDHRLVIGRVVAGSVLNPDEFPMNYRETGDMDASSGLYPDGFT